jgi:hypothetical protein
MTVHQRVIKNMEIMGLSNGTMSGSVFEYSNKLTNAIKRALYVTKVAVITLASMFVAFYITFLL